MWKDELHPPAAGSLTSTGPGCGPASCCTAADCGEEERTPLLACGPFYLSQVSSFSCSSSVSRESFILPLSQYFHRTPTQKRRAPVFRSIRPKESEILFFVWAGDKGKKEGFLSPDLVEFKVFAV